MQFCMKKKLLILISFLNSIFAVAENKVLQLYPEGDANLQKVTIQYFIPQKSSGSAVIVCPGGGYAGLCDTYEGVDTARYLNQFGITSIVLRYRVGRNLNATPLDDVLNAVRYVRENADKYGINPDSIGIIGFSAGGHLASLAATYGQGISKVNFQILIYPVISLADEITHKGSQINFLGTLLNEENKQKYSSNLQVTASTPPAFICHSVTDRIVSVKNSRMYVEALEKFNIPVTYLELPRGAHGFGASRSPEWKIWQDACKEWLIANKFGIYLDLRIYDKQR